MPHSSDFFDHFKRLLAMERDEINGYPSVFYNSLMATKPTWVKEGKIKLLVQMGDEKEDDIANVPFLTDLITKDEDKRLAEAAFAPLSEHKWTPSLKF